MTIGGIENVPGAGGNLRYRGQIAGIQLPLPGQLNRGGSFRQPGYRPGGEVEEIPTRPMAPSDYQGQPSIPAQGVPFAFNSQVPIGNVGGMDEFLANTQGVPWAPRTTLPSPGWNPDMLPAGSTFRPSPQWERRGGPNENQRTGWQAAGFQNKTLS